MSTLIHAPHAHSRTSVGRLMALVMAALVPATLFGFWLNGWPAVNLWLVTMGSAIAFEFFSLRLAGQPPKDFLFDGSAALTAWLLALSLPPWAPWWIGALGSFLAVVVAKHVFGGIGQNLFNPAMVARVALLISFPVEMTQWVTPAPLFSGTAPGFLDAPGHHLFRHSQHRRGYQRLAARPYQDGTVARRQRGQARWPATT